MPYDEDPKQSPKEGSEEKEEESFSFLQETIKPKPLSREKILSQFARIAVCGILFGVFACLSFFALKPWAQRHLQGDPKTVTIPEDEEGEEGEATDEDQEEEASPPNLSAGSYTEIMDSMYEIAEQANRGVASVTAVSSSEDWESMATGIEQSVTGVIVADNGQELLVLSDNSICSDAKEWKVTFTDGSKYGASLKKQDKNRGLAVFAVARDQISDKTWSEIRVAELGNSNISVAGDVVIALGGTFGYGEGTGYGIISSNNYKEVFSDGECEVIATDISASEDGTGILFNQDGQVIGLISPDIWEDKGGTTANALAISDLKPVIELLVNGESVPYLGIYGAAVTEEIAQKQGMPSGVYVMQVAADSPAMVAGIQSGDILQVIGSTGVNNALTYEKAVRESKVGNTIRIEGSRLGADGYVDIEFSVTVGSQE